MSDSCDILISGGGIAGLTAAAAFGSAGFTVQCVDPMPPITERDAEGSDLRTTAFLQPARGLLEEAGLWALSTITFGLPGLYIPAVAMVPIIWTVLITITMGK